MSAVTPDYGRPVTHQPWWQSTVVYQIYPRSFADASGDGIGDLAGIEAHLDHIAGLGVGAIWLSPIYPSPQADFGYDVADYCDVDPTFGSLGDLDRLVAAAHGRALKVLLDWVPNHTSNQHPWFLESRSSRTNPKRDWYVWRDSAPGGGPPNNWIAEFSGGREPAWTFDQATGQWYLHLFLPEQPDLNWDHPDVRAAMHATLRFWLDRGVDGFRMDVIHLIGKLEGLPDDDADRVAAGLSHVPLNDAEVTHERLQDLRRLLDSYPHEPMMVGEVFLLSPRRVARYYGDNDELHLSFNFAPMFAPWTAEAWRGQVDAIQQVLDPIGAWPTWVLGNHDRPRQRTRYGSDARACAAAFLVLGLRGTPFLYAGEELGLADAIIPPDRVVDPGGRDGCRAPIPWTKGSGHGWGTTTEPWLPFAPDAAARSVEAAEADRDSTLHLYRRLLALRQRSPALSTGTFEWLPAPDGVLSWRRTAAEGGGDAVADDGSATEAVVVVVSFVTESRVLPNLVGATVLVATDRSLEGRPWSGSLDPDAALVLRAPERALGRPLAGQTGSSRRLPLPSKLMAASPLTRRWMSSPSTSARQPTASRAPGAPFSSSFRSLRVAKSAVSIF